MIPVMKDKNKGKMASLIMNATSSNVEETEENDDSGYGLEESMNKFMVALQSGDAKKAAEAFSEAFQMCEMQPHEEAAHE
jgi:hypothetical protein